MTEPNPKLRQEYAARINRVIDYIDSNLSNDFSADQLASIANFSRFHFHRIFSAIVGETLFQFIQRLRLERAASQLITNTNKSITEILYDCGFSGPSVFTRAFKELFGMSPSDWRIKGCVTNSKESQMIGNYSKPLSNYGKNEFRSFDYFWDEVNHKSIWRLKMGVNSSKNTNFVEVKELADMHLVYVRNIGPYQGDSQLFENLFGKLCRWAGPRGLLSGKDLKFISVYHDSPDITDPDKLRISVGITVPESTQVDGEIGKMKIEGGQYAVARFEIPAEKYGEAWDAVYSDWLPESGYQPDDRPCFELYLNDPKQHPQNLHIVDICVPVKPL